MPVAAGMIKINQLYEPGLGYDDILDLNEIMAVKSENEYRAMKANEKARKNS